VQLRIERGLYAGRAGGPGEPRTDAKCAGRPAADAREGRAIIAASHANVASAGECGIEDIGNAERVTLMERLVALKVEHRDLDTIIHRLTSDPTHDQLQLTRLKRRKLLLKDQIGWLERQIDPDVSA
jgi:hypothetical protein